MSDVMQIEELLPGLREKIENLKFKQSEELKKLEEQKRSTLSSVEFDFKRKLAKLVKEHDQQLVGIQSIKAGFCCTCQVTVDNQHIVCEKCSGDFCASHSTKMTLSMCCGKFFCVSCSDAIKKCEDCARNVEQLRCCDLKTLWCGEVMCDMCDMQHTKWSCEKKRSKKRKNRK